jgi:FMN phosphatase YigB (HAD superfamily)
MQQLRAVLFDFDGVLCTDHFYTTLKQKYPQVIKFINENIFSGPQHYADRWMKGEFSYHQINKLISDTTGIPFEELTELFKTSVRQMKISPALIQLALLLKKRGTKIALVTGNMDIFNEITIPEKHLADIFSVIVNSCDYKMGKYDDNGKLFDIALEKLGLSSFQGVLLVDDSLTSCTIFTAKGGLAHQYSGQAELELWLKRFFPDT